MYYKKCFAAIAIMAIAACAVLGIVFVVRNNLKMGIDLPLSSVSAEVVKQFNAESQGDNQLREAGLLEKTEQENETITTETPASTDSSTISPSDMVAKEEYFAEIKIKTYERTGTYAVMSDVNEKTLKDNIGWLQSSSMPGEDGLCVLMGHRDTDFKILKYVEVGDEIIIDYGVTSYVYTVIQVDIVNNDNELRFSVMSGSNLALVTCYPFHYEGNATKKLIAYALLYKNDLANDEQNNLLAL